MKNRFVLIVVLALVVLITNSCNKNKDAETLTVTIDNTAYSIDGSSITYTTAASGANTNYTFTITLGNVPLYMYLPSLKTGTYKFSSVYNPGPGFLLYGANNETYVSEKNNVPARGSIIITASTGSTISGSFSGVLYPEPFNSIKYTDSTTINSGVFSNVQF
jgi:hypothetical protein